MTHPYLTDDHHIFRQALRKFLEKEAYPHYDKWEEDRIIPRTFWEKLGQQGFLCPDLPERYGGAETDWGFSVVIEEELERVGTGLVGVSLHNDIVVPYITDYGSGEQKNRWLPKCTTGETITALAMTEPGAGSDLANIKTTAIRQGDHYVLNGQKTFITNGIHADLVVVACKTDPKAEPKHKGVSLLVVERGTEGFSRGRKLDKIGLHCQDTAELIFEDCRVPAENLLGEEGKGFLYMMDKLQQERLAVAIGAQVASEEMLHDTIDYTRSRKAFGQAVSDFQNTRFRLAEIATEIEMGRTFLDDLIDRHIKGEDVVKQVSMAKYKLTETARHTATVCMQLHGGYGYMEEYKIARRYRDTPVSSIYAGTNEIMKTIIAKKIGL
ncbi:acyl-CoA dehydrogenase family protein [Alteribacter natronophilus]|uniref:acyl-CoA dehydrogenase family protein n=1 Tax=Alteribacter natronophilus TaxID=2583810 RepID=UPI00110EB66E|nr:acyl-CoA dehydrogenase family protein [Alteribacter natronophilus]TMW72899.1 acyl-CoA dehydrogenase [Alteribacter natronophilus]